LALTTVAVASGIQPPDAAEPFDGDQAATVSVIDANHEVSPRIRAAGGKCGSAEQGDLFGLGGPRGVAGQCSELPEVDPIGISDHAAEQLDGDLDVRHSTVPVGRGGDLQVSQHVVQAMAGEVGVRLRASRTVSIRSMWARWGQCLR